MARRPRLVEIGKPIVDEISDINICVNEHHGSENDSNQTYYRHESSSSLMRMSNQQQACKQYTGKRKGKVISKIIIGQTSPAINESNRTTDEFSTVESNTNIYHYSSTYIHDQTNKSIDYQFPKDSQNTHTNSSSILIQSKNHESINSHPILPRSLNQFNIPCTGTRSPNTKIERSHQNSESCNNYNNNNNNDDNSMNMEVDEINAMEASNIDNTVSNNHFHHFDFGYNDQHPPSEMNHINSNSNNANNLIDTTTILSMNYNQFHQPNDTIDSVLVLLDGANIAYAYGQAMSEEEPNVKGIALAVDYFLNCQGVHVQVVLPSYWCRKKSNFLPKGENAMMQTESFDLLQSMKTKGLLCLTPPTDDDDAYMIAIATTCTDSKTYIVSNDLFRDAIRRDEQQHRQNNIQQLQQRSNNHNSLQSYSHNDEYSSKHQRRNLRDWFHEGGRISYSFYNIGPNINTNSTTSITDSGYINVYNGSQMKFIPNPRHKLIEKFQIM